MRRQGSKKKKTLTAPSFVIEMDPALAANLKGEPTRVLPRKSPAQIVGELQHAKQSASSSTSSEASAGKSEFSFKKDATTPDASEREAAEASKREQRRIDEMSKEMSDILDIKTSWTSSNSPKKRSRRIRRLQAKLQASKATSSSTTTSTASAPSSSSPDGSEPKDGLPKRRTIVLTEAQRKMARKEIRKKFKELEKNPVKKSDIWSWKKIQDTIAEHKELIEAMDLLRYVKRKGKVARMVRPPPTRVAWAQQQARDSRSQTRQIGRAGVLPRTILRATGKQRALEQLPEEFINWVSRYYTSRHTSLLFIALFALAFMTYELWLTYNEKRFDEQPEELEVALRHYLSSNGEYTAQLIARRLRDQEIRSKREETWHGIKKGWMPDAVWRHWIAAKEAKTDILVYTFSTIYDSISGYISNLNVSAYMNSSRFWIDRAFEAHMPEHLIASLKSNGMLPDPVNKSSRWALHKALVSYDASSEFLAFGGIGALLHSAPENSLMTTEALLLRTALSSSDKVARFWKLPEEVITGQLESMVIHCEQKSLLVAYTASALLGYPIASVAPYHQHLLCLLLEKLNDPKVTTTALGESFVSNASKNFLEFVPTLAKSSDEGSLLVEKLRQRVENASEMVATELPDPKRYHFELENVSNDPSLAWLLFMLPASALYVTMRYNSNALWNGLGELPLRLRFAKVSSRAFPAFVAAYSWLTFDAYSRRLSEQWSQYVQETVKGEKGPTASGRQNPLGSSTKILSKSTASGLFGSLVVATKSALLWQFPFIWAPQVASQIFAWPFAKFRQWRFYRLESRER